MVANVHARGWAAGQQREMELCPAEEGFLLRVQDCGEYFITRDGGSYGSRTSKANLHEREILLGPVIVLAQALQGIWSLHASAAIHNGKAIAFLGESGAGKSTLAAYLSQQAGWQRAADDILPVELQEGVRALPHVEQLKLSKSQQPALFLPPQIPLHVLCLLAGAKEDEKPRLQKLDSAQTVQALLAHTAGTRLFPAALLANHLNFAAQAAPRLAAYQLTYPRRREALPMVKKILEEEC